VFERSATLRVMEILRATPDEAATLTEIAFAAKRHWGYPELWIKYWTDTLTIRPAFITEHETCTARIDGRSVGFHALRRGVDRVHLEHLWVLPETMRRGVGRALFAHAIERVKVIGFEMLEIESDPHAAGFYERMGARQIGVTITEMEARRRELPVFVYEIKP